MDIEHLNKTQIVLLTLLISFVTSIATGIATVSLIDQAPPGVTQTIHKVVERTVETISVPSEGEPAVVTQEKTIIVNEEDAITESIATLSESLVRLITDQDIAATEVREQGETFVGMGVVASEQGVIITTSPLVIADRTDDYTATLPDGTQVTAEVRTRDTARGVTVLVAQVTLEQNTVFTPVAFADASTLRLGQKTLGLGGEVDTRVSEGIISHLETTDIAGEDGTIQTTLRRVHSSAAARVPSTPLANIFGELIGLSSGAESSHYVPANVLQAALAG